jgi:hypothetical protein
MTQKEAAGKSFFVAWFQIQRFNPFFSQKSTNIMFNATMAAVQMNAWAII